MAVITKIAATAQDLFYAAAIDFSERAIATIKRKNIFRVLLLGGESAQFFFKALTSIEFCKEKTPWNQIQFFFGDERYVPLEDCKSNYYTAYTHLFSKLPILKSHIFAIPTHFSNPQKAANAYSRTLKKLFNRNDSEFLEFDLVYLGMGEDGHTASLMPFSEPVIYPSNDLVVSLWVPELNMTRITLTPFAVNHAHCIIFLVTGQKKATALREVLKGEITLEHSHQYPAQLIHCINGDTFWYIDQGAAKNL